MPLDIYESQFLQGAIEVPHSIMMWIIRRPQDATRLRLAINRAVEYSFEHEDTKMRIITQNELKSRAQLAMDIVERMYIDFELVITQIADQLPEILVGVIRDVCVDLQGGVVEQRIKGEVEPGRWTVPLNEPERQVLVDTSENLADEAGKTDDAETGEDELEQMPSPNTELDEVDLELKG